MTDEHGRFDEGDFENALTGDFGWDENKSADANVPIEVPVIRVFEDLTLAEMLGQFWRAPRATWSALVRVLHDSDSSLAVEIPREPPSVQMGQLLEGVEVARVDVRVRNWLSDATGVQFTLYLIAFVIAFFGNSRMAVSQLRVEQDTLNEGVIWLIAGFAVWAFAEVYGSFSDIIGWWFNKNWLGRTRAVARLFPLFLVLNGIRILAISSTGLVEEVIGFVSAGVQSIAWGLFFWILIDVSVWFLSRLYLNNPAVFPAWVQEQLGEGKGKKKHDQDAEVLREALTSIPISPLQFIRIYPARLIALGSAIIASVIAWLGTSGNLLQTYAFYAWLISIVLWGFAFSPPYWNPVQSVNGWWVRLRGFRFRGRGALALVITTVMLVAAGFRLTQLDTVPPEMTSDHVEKLLDSQRVLDGTHQIFFANNGGREPFQMYAMALFSRMPGLSMNFDTLKLLAVIESLVTLPAMMWMGRELIGDRRMGTLVGLLLGALVAVSYWHLVITRLSLRIVLTPLVTSLLLIYLARALRRNQRADFIKAGLVLGFGLYTYQAVRMLPVVVVVGVAIAFWQAQSWEQRRAYMINLAVLTLIAFVVFLPMFHYSVDYPEDFWRRTSGRLLGDDVLEETLANGTIIERRATLQERIDAFNQNLPVLMNNIRNVLLMFNWKGDVAWINGAPNQPTMDPFTGALLVVGSAAWGARVLRRRDPVDILIPLMLFIMLMPSALSIAYPIENPSHTRTSGALPEAFILCALPFALMVDRYRQLVGQSVGRVVSVGICLFILGGAYSSNSNVLFTTYYESYKQSSLPYSEAGRVLQGFAISDGSYGNAFMIAYPYWWDHRALGLEAGLVNWPNGIVTRDDIPRFIYTAEQRRDRYRFDPTRDILFFLSQSDAETISQLKIWFPEGREIPYPSYQPEDSFMLFRVPALGAENFEAFLAANNVP